jgi:hypothetical protein
MKTEGLRRELLTEPVPDELEAARRVWAVVRAAYSDREPVPPVRRHGRAALALAFVVALLAAAFTPPGRAVGDWIRDTVRGREPSEPALFALPAAGRLLVDSEQGPWVVQVDGAKRLLGDYDGASWSPQGRFVVVTAGRRVLALEPDGDPRWSLTRPQTLTAARWAPSGFRVAYRAGATLRVVVGNGTGDRLLARRVAPVAPAWRPGAAHLLAFADEAGRVLVVDSDSGDTLWARRTGRPRELVWSGDGRLLLALGTGRRHHLFTARGRLVRTIEQPPGHVALRAAFAPRGPALALADYEPEGDRGAVVLLEDPRASSPRAVFRGAGRLEDLAWSPSGRWLLAGWPSADQWLFLRMPDVERIIAVSDVTREFDPGATGGGGFPRLAGWCCAPAG